MIRHDFVSNIIINQNPIIVINKFVLAIDFYRVGKRLGWGLF